MIETIILFLFMFILSYSVTRVFRSTRGNNDLIQNMKEYDEKQKKKGGRL